MLCSLELVSVYLAHYYQPFKRMLRQFWVIEIKLKAEYFLCTLQSVASSSHLLREGVRKNETNSGHIACWNTSCPGKFSWVIKSTTATLAKVLYSVHLAIKNRKDREPGVFFNLETLIIILILCQMKVLIDWLPTSEFLRVIAKYGIGRLTDIEFEFRSSQDFGDKRKSFC